MRKVDRPKDESFTNFEFIETPFPKGFKVDYEGNLFNSKEHRKLQSSKDWYSFHLIRKDKKKILASIHFCIKEKIASSPWSAPFGSFELSDVITSLQIFEFISFCEKKLIQHGAKKILIKNFPEQYHARNHNSLSVLLFNHNYFIKNAELGACISVDDLSFLNKIDTWEKRKLKQATNAALSFKTIPLRDIKKTYQFILSCREERGKSLSMSLKNLSETTSKLKDHFFAFGVFQERKLIAASISIKVNRNTLYNFYSAHSKETDAFSPAVFLTNGIYLWCQSHHIKLLDLGTSAWGGRPNFSLIDFKLRLGAEPTMKLTFEKELK